MAATGTPTSPFIHQSFMSINQRRAPHSRPETPASNQSHHSAGMHSASSSSPGGILDPPPGLSYADFVKQWQDPHIARWLADNRCAQHAPAFRDNDIRGDIILELDMDTLKEIGITSVGDRTRIRSAIKDLRRLCAGVSSQAQAAPRVLVNGTSSDLRVQRTSGLKLKGDVSTASQDPIDGSAASLRNSRSRPPPLQIDNVREKDLPQIQRLDSARSAGTPTPRPPANGSRTSQRDGQQQVGVPPRGAPPVTPLATRQTPRLTVPPASTQRSRTPTSESPHPPPFTNEPLPPAPSPASPWMTTPQRGLPTNPAPGNLGGGSFAGRATSPLPQGRNRDRAQNPSSVMSHQRQGSGTNRSHGSNSSHPYSSPNASLAPIPIASHILSPVNETFMTISGSPPTGYSVGKGPFKAGQPQGAARDDDLRKKLIKFHFGDVSRVLEVRDLEDGTDLLERALRKFNVPLQYGHQPEMDGSLSVGGWAVSMGSSPDGE
jgi:mitogen-activated protein kinase kinase kinase